MGVITIEFADRHEEDEPCSCCGTRSTRLTRFVYSDGDAHAVYYARYSDGHPHRWVSALISLGEWGEGGTPSDRVAFPVRFAATDDAFQVSLVDAADSPWHEVTFLGRVLNRTEALKHPLKAEVFHITDHIVTDDPDVREYFAD